jgi:hypothetical protein
LSISSIVAHTSTTALTTLLANAVVNNAGSNTVAKLEDLILCNTTNSVALANVIMVRQSGTFALASNISIPAYSLLAVLGKDTPLYLEEGDYLQGQSTTSVNMFIGYDIIST